MAVTDLFEVKVYCHNVLIIIFIEKSAPADKFETRFGKKNTNTVRTRIHNRQNKERKNMRGSTLLFAGHFTRIGYITQS
jgi:hypothetical protein